MKRAHREYFAYRALEILPGAFVWATFGLVLYLSIAHPFAAIYLIIAFDLYWFVRISYLMIYVLISWRQYRIAARRDWQEALESLAAQGGKQWRDYWHVIFLPTYKEPYEVVVASVRAIAASAYGDKKQMIVVLAGEGRDAERFNEIAGRISGEFQHVFHSLIITVHPAGLPGDLPGKGSNLYFAGHAAKRHIDSLGIQYEKIIVSTFDIDTIANPQYFSYLTHQFLTHPNPYRASFQPLTFYHNNIWESDMVTRVVANSTTFWLLTDLARSERLFTFSSHSMSWQALVDIGFWQNNIVTEDSRIFLQCFIRYNGDYKVIPMYTTVSMNTVYMGSWWRSLINQYKQMRRWAYGVEHFPYMVWHFYHNKDISRTKKIAYLWNQTEGVYSWATAPIVMFVMGHVPLWVAHANDDASFIAQQAPLVLSGIMTVALWGVITIAILSTYALPRSTTSNFPRTVVRYLFMLLQWALFPVTMIVFGALPAIDAQTRLMLGRYLDFWVTEKQGALPSENRSVPAQKVA